ncbi:MAG: protein kinase [Nannocystaceae bacterium]
MDESSDLFRGQLVAGRYEIERLVGEGGMGTVYLARDHHLSERRVALKVLHARYVGRTAREQRFLNEAHFSALTGRLPYHTNIAATLDRGRMEDGRPFTAMEYVDGPAISGLSVVVGRQLSADEVCGLAHGIASAMEVLHDAGLVHRDLTPMNVLVATVGDQWIPKVIDLSHAASISGPKLQFGHPDRLTQPHEVPGTPGYMAPEQVASAYPSPAMDVFSFGVTLWELLTDRHSYRERDRGPYFTLQREHPKPPPSLAEHRAGLPSALVRLVEACTDIDPSKRPTPKRIREWLDAARLELHIQHEPKPEPGLTAVPKLEVEPRTGDAPGHRGPARTGREAPPVVQSPAQQPQSPRPTPMPEDSSRRRVVVVVVLISLLMVALLVGWILLMTEREPARVDEPRPAVDEVASVHEAQAPASDEASPPQAPVPSEPAVEPPNIESPEPVEPVEPVVEDEPTVDPPATPKRPNPTQRRSKTQRRPAPAKVEEDCGDTVADAEQARRSRQWKRVLTLTKSGRCWDDQGAREWARVRALLELGRYADCAALASSSSNPDVVRMGTICAETNAEKGKP